MTVVHMQPAELRYHQEMLKLARKTHSAVDELKQQEECLPLVNLFLDSVDQVCAGCTCTCTCVCIHFLSVARFKRVQSSSLD